MIRAGMGGWNFAPWRGVFYPPGLPHARELDYASRHVTAIEINATFYRTQSPKTFRRWADETPDGFVFALKASGYVVNRKVLAETGSGIAGFLRSGLIELGPKLGPILWQLAPSKPFDEADISAFLALLPRQMDGRQLSHAIEVRHASFVDPRFVALARRFGVAVVYTDAARYPEIADVTGDFVYARLQRGVDDEPTGYPAEALDRWAERARIWAEGGDPSDLPRLGEPAAKVPRPVYVFFIHDGKLRAPAAAQALIERIGPQ